MKNLNNYILLKSTFVGNNKKIQIHFLKNSNALPIIFFFIIRQYFLKTLFAVLQYSMKEFEFFFF